MYGGRAPSRRSSERKLSTTSIPSALRYRRILHALLAIIQGDPRINHHMPGWRHLHLLLLPPQLHQYQCVHVVAIASTTADLRQRGELGAAITQCGRPNTTVFLRDCDQRETRGSLTTVRAAPRSGACGTRGVCESALSLSVRGCGPTPSARLPRRCARRVSPGGCRHSAYCCEAKNSHPGAVACCVGLSFEGRAP